MLGHRGCRLGISFPEIYEMQCRAIFTALLECKKEKLQSLEEIKIHEEVKPKKSAKEWGRASNDPRNKT